MKTGKRKIAIVVSHPIQHFCPQYTSITKQGLVELKVFFASTLGYKKYIDPNFKQEIVWGDLKLDQFEHQFLNGDAALQPDKHIDADALEDALGIFEPDLVIIYGYFQKLQKRAYTWANNRGIPLAYISDSERRQKRNWVKEQIKARYLRKYFSRIDYFLTVGNANEEYYQYYGVPESKLLRMHFSIDLDMYQKTYAEKEALRSAVRSEQGIGETEITLSVVGKLVPWKSQHHIIRAMQLLEREGLYLHLFILGSGETMAACKEEAARLAHSKVHFPGFVPADQLPAYYAATDIYVHPAMTEPHSLGISEAIYMGCPVILSNRCGSYGQDDDVQVGRNGFVYDFGDIEALAGYIRQLAEDVSLRKVFSDYSHDLAVQFQERSHKKAIEDLVFKLNHLP